MLNTNNRKNIVKRVISCCIILLLSINSFATTVTDNNGSAFITKAEFDALKSSFQAQIDSYNQNIDSKIDNAIVSYLSGINIAKKIELTVPVTNWNQIVWKRKFDVYGSYCSWTKGPNDSDRTVGATRTQSLNTWYVPFADKRRGGIRNGTFTMYGYFCRARGGWAYGLRGAWVLDSLGPIGGGDNQSYSAANPYVFTIQCDNIDDEIKVVEGDPFLWEGSIIDRTYIDNIGGGYYPINSDNCVDWSDAGASTTYAERPVIPMQVDDSNVDKWLTNIGGDAYALNCEIIAYHLKNNDKDFRYIKLPLSLKKGSYPETVPWLKYANGRLEKITNPTAWVNSTACRAEFFDNGCHEQYIDASTINQQKEDFKYMMFGKDCDTKENVFMLGDLNNNGCIPLYTNADTEWITTKLKLNQFQLGGTHPYVLQNADGSYKEYHAKGEVNYTGHEKEVEYKIPLLNQYEVRKMTSGKIKNGNANLKIGEGLPLSERLVSDGNLNIELKWEMGRSAGSVPSGNAYQAIDIDIKKTNFLDSTSDYYQGSVNGGVQSPLHDFTLNPINNTAKIVIDNVKKGEGVWIRIAPNKTDGGLKAKLTDLKVELVNE